MILVRIIIMIDETQMNPIALKMIFIIIIESS